MPKDYKIRWENMNYFEKAVDALDDAIFNGESLFKKDAQELLEQSLKRWRLELSSWRELTDEVKSA